MPSVVAVTAAFEAGARATARARGYEALPIVVFGADLEEQPEDRQRVEMGARLEEILAGLRRG